MNVKLYLLTHVEFQNHAIARAKDIFRARGYSHSVNTSKIDFTSTEVIVYFNNCETTWRVSLGIEQLEMYEDEWRAHVKSIADEYTQQREKFEADKKKSEYYTKLQQFKQLEYELKKLEAFVDSDNYIQY